MIRTIFAVVLFLFVSSPAVADEPELTEAVAAGIRALRLYDFDKRLTASVGRCALIRNALRPIATPSWTTRLTVSPQCFRLDPKNVCCLYFRGRAFAAKLDYDKAIEDYSATIRLDPKNPAVFLNRAKAYVEKMDLQGNQRLHRGDSTRFDSGRCLQLPRHRPQQKEEFQ